MTDRLALRDAARRAIAAEHGPDEEDIHIIEVQERRAGPVAKYVLESVETVRYEQFDPETLDAKQGASA